VVSRLQLRQKIAKSLHLLGLNERELSDLTGLLPMMGKVVIALADALDRRRRIELRLTKRNDPRRVTDQCEMHHVIEQPHTPDEIREVFDVGRRGARRFWLGTVLPLFRFMKANFGLANSG